MTPSFIQEMESIVADAQVKTLKSLVKILDVDKDLVQEFLMQTRKGKGITKKSRTRPPSAYNFYIRDKMAELRQAGYKGNVMRLAIDAWNDLKAQEVINVLEG